MESIKAVLPGELQPAEKLHDSQQRADAAAVPASARLKKEAAVVMKELERKGEEGKASHRAYDVCFDPEDAAGALRPEQLVQALRRVGFDFVFDLRFGADVTIMEEASELLQRVKNGGPFPCSPPAALDVRRPARAARGRASTFAARGGGGGEAGQAMVTEECPEVIPLLSTCKSPQGMTASIARTAFCAAAGVDPDRLVVTSVVPCFMKRLEASRGPLQGPRHRVDHVVTVRELGRCCGPAGGVGGPQRGGPEGRFTDLMGGSGAGALFGVTGGVMEAAVRTAYELATGRRLERVEVRDARGLFGVKEGSVPLGLPGLPELKYCVVCGVNSIQRVVKKALAGASDYHFVEVMLCPQGCISGPGAPRSRDKGIAKRRAAAIYGADERATVRRSHENPAVGCLYARFFGQPLSSLSHELLHTAFKAHELAEAAGAGSRRGTGTRAPPPWAPRSRPSRRASPPRPSAPAPAVRRRPLAGPLGLTRAVAGQGGAGGVRVGDGERGGVARQLARDIAARGVPVTCSEADALEMDELPRTPVLLVVISTAGQGEVPDNAREFVAGLSGSLPRTWLRGLRSAVFGLGDSSYARYNAASAAVEARLAALGAAPLLPRGLGDDQAPDKFETGLAAWAPALFDALRLPAAREEAGPRAPSHRTLLSAGEPGAPPRAFGEAWRPILTDPSAQLVRLGGNERLTPAGYERDIRHLTFEVDAIPEPLRYTVGDALAVYPRNDPGETGALLRRLGLEPGDGVAFEALEAGPGARPRPPLPPGTTLLDYACDCMDLFGGRPGARFFAGLAPFASDPAQRAALEALADPSSSPAAPAALAALEAALVPPPPPPSLSSRGGLKCGAGRVTHAGVLESFPSARPPLDHLLDLVPPMKPRYYSISSSPHLKKGRLELSVVINEWRRPDGSPAYGLCTGYLRALTGGPHWVAASLKPGVGICMPPHPSTPVVMVGLGTGIAPMRAIVQERVWQGREGKGPGATALFLGLRHRRTEFLYEEEWAGAGEAGALTHLSVAFSHDTPERGLVFVQERIAEQPALLYELLARRGGHLFYCGPGGRVPGDVRAAVEAALAAGGAAEGYTRGAASALLEGMRREARAPPQPP
eukprot:tig00021537_g22312.t1